MALGGGTFTSQSKELPGTYINFISAASVSSIQSDRGVAAIALDLDWGTENKIIEVSNGDFYKSSMKIFGYSYDNDKMKGLRDLFKNITTLYTYRLNSGGVKATNTYATALCSGTRGNSIKISIQANVDNISLFDVSTIIDTSTVDIQTVANASALKDNDYVTFKTDATLAVTAATALTGGTNGTSDGSSHQSYLDKLEAYSFNALGVISTETTIKTLYTNFTKRMRDEVGIKFQLVAYQNSADYEGAVNVKNSVIDNNHLASALIYWVTGIIAGCAVNGTNSNKIYDGEFTVNTDYTQVQLESALKAGEFVLHKVNKDIRVLEDINSLVTTTDTKGTIFKSNQTIRIIDQIANDIAIIFNTKYLGTVPNDKAGRISLWSDIVKHHQDLNNIRAIEDFDEKDVVVTQGDSKKSVIITDTITIINAMEKLYMTVTIA